jgi:hypothetical protein
VLDCFGERAPSSLACGKCGQPPLVSLLKQRAVGVGLLQIALDFGTVDPGIKVAQVPLGQRAEPGLAERRRAVDAGGGMTCVLGHSIRLSLEFAMNSQDRDKRASGNREAKAVNAGLRQDDKLRGDVR